MRDKNLWVFNAGNAFAGNPKWLFLYIQAHHSEIECVWLCYRQKLVNRMRAMGYQAYLYKSHAARTIGERAGVYVVEQNKERFQPWLQGITVLNLWHGVTCKKLEHAVVEGYMEEGLVAKHIRNESIYRQQLMLVTSPDQERVFIEQCKIPEENVIRAPYPNSFEKTPIQTFDHDFRAAKGVAPSTKVALYAPTFRDFNRDAFFERAIPDMDTLVQAAEANGWMLIIKVHPQMEKDFQLKALKHRYGSNQSILFWDNANDIYEVMDQIDMAIVDYSSIFFDLLAHGVKRFVRYIYDYDDKDQLRDFAFDYLEVTCGEVCRTFDELVGQFSTDEQTPTTDLERVREWAWAYSKDHTVEEIVARAMDHQPALDAALPVLYSFDIFDTLITRTTGSPDGVFAYVEQKIRQSNLRFPSELAYGYCKVRKEAEKNCRELVAKTLELRRDNRTEIEFNGIFERLRDLYELDDEQTEALKNWELEGELATTVPIKANIDKVLHLVDEGETVLLISDMYLPEAFVKKLLEQADPVLAGLPLFLSSSTGRQKTKKGLFLDAFHAIDYHYGQWVHFGDNQLADVDKPAEIGIHSQLLETPSKPDDPYCKQIAQAMDSYDGYLIGNYQARMLGSCDSLEDRFACGYASTYLVPYVYWVLDHAKRHGIECLYFISRDGYLLKCIADAIIETRELPMETRYLYGSRKVWRVPSQIEAIDDGFFASYGNFTGVTDFASLVAASAIGEERFVALFPELAYLKDAPGISKTERDRIVEKLRDSKPYRNELLEAAKELRTIAVDYLRQEIDFSKKFAFVEFWGRGYTQECHTRLLMAADSRVQNSTYYYARSICPSDVLNIRYNFTPTSRKMLFIERLFANLPYKTIAQYERDGDRVVPVLESNECNQEVLEALERQLPSYASGFAALPFTDPDRTMRALFDFGIDYFYGNLTQDVFLKCIAPLKDSITIQGEPNEYAPTLTPKRAIDYLRGDKSATHSMSMTLARTNPVFGKLVKLIGK